MVSSNFFPPQLPQASAGSSLISTAGSTAARPAAGNAGIAGSVSVLPAAGPALSPVGGMNSSAMMMMMQMMVQLLTMLMGGGGLGSVLPQAGGAAAPQVGASQIPTTPVAPQPAALPQVPVQAAPTSGNAGNTARPGASVLQGINDDLDGILPTPVAQAPAQAPANNSGNAGNTARPASGFPFVYTFDPPSYVPQPPVYTPPQPPVYRPEPPTYRPPAPPPTPFPPGGFFPPFPNFPPFPQPGPTPIYIPPGTKGKVWGDPHFVGFFNGVKETQQTGDLDGNGRIGDTLSQLYDVQGVAGQSYRVLTDSNLNVNGEIAKYGDAGATVFSEISTSVRGEDGMVYRVNTKANPGEAPTVTMPDGRVVTLENGKAVQLGGANQSATWDAGAKRVAIKTTEYELGVTQQTNPVRNYLDLDTTKTARFDGMNHDGLLGVSGRPDLIGKIANGKQGAQAQGEGVATKGEGGRGADRTEQSYRLEGGVNGTNNAINSFNTRMGAPLPAAAADPPAKATGAEAKAADAKPAAAGAAAAPPPAGPAPAKTPEPPAKPEPAKK